MKSLKVAGGIVLLSLLLGNRLFSAEKEKWWNESFEYRVPLTLKETAGIERKKVPVLITGEVLIKKTGASDINTCSLRLVNSKAGEIPVQVDEKDKTGVYQTSPNYRLDPDDEVLFQVDLGANKEEKYYLYFRRKLTPEPEFSSDVVFEKVTITPQKPYNASLSNPRLFVGIRGTGEEEYESKGQKKKIFGGGGKGSITSFKIGKTDELIHTGRRYQFISATQKMVSWSNPELVTEGAVRKTIEVRADNVDDTFKRKGGEWTVTEPTKGYLKGKIYRYYSLYNGLPYLECQEVYVVEDASPDFSIGFLFPLRTTVKTSVLARGDVLYIPAGRKEIQIKLGDDRDFDTKVPSEGWVGLLNQGKEIGLALFFDKEKSVRVYAGLVRSHYRKNVGEERDWSLGSDFAVVYKIEGMNAKKVASNRFGLYALKGEKAEEIRSRYSGIWGSPLEMKWGFPEEKE